MEVFGVESFVPKHLRIEQTRPTTYYKISKDVVEGLRMGNDRPPDTGSHRIGGQPARRRRGLSILATWRKAAQLCKKGNEHYMDIVSMF